MRKSKLFMLLLFLVTSMGYALAQTKTVEGIVIYQEDNEPVIGATVVIKGSTTHGTLTDIDGKFTLNNVPASAKSVEVSYVGMKPKEMPIKAFMKIFMETDTQVLEEVVVTGMTKVDKRLFTGASVKVDGDAVKMDGMPDPSRALDGKAAGVSVQNVSGTFGAAPKINVRGATSIYGNSKPL